MPSPSWEIVAALNIPASGRPSARMPSRFHLGHFESWPEGSAKRHRSAVRGTGRRRRLNREGDELAARAEMAVLVGVVVFRTRAVAEPENVPREHVLPQDRDHLAIQAIESETQICRPELQEHTRGAVQRKHATVPSSRSSPASHFGSVSCESSSRTPPGSSMSTPVSVIGRGTAAPASCCTSTKGAEYAPALTLSRRRQYVSVESASPCRAQKAFCERPLRSYRTSHRRHSAAPRR